MNDIQRDETLITHFPIPLETLLDFPIACTIAFLNDIDKKVLVKRTSNLWQLLSGMKTSLEMDDVIKDKNKVQLIILAKDNDKKLVIQWEEKYRLLGYSNYKSRNRRYKLMPKVAKINNIYCYELYFISDTNNKILIGRYSKYEDMKNVIDNEYSNYEMSKK